MEHADKPGLESGERWTKSNRTDSGGATQQFGPPTAQPDRTLEDPDRERRERTRPTRVPPALFPPGPGDRDAWAELIGRSGFQVAPATRRFDWIVLAARRAGISLDGIPGTPEHVGRAIRQACVAPEVKSEFRRQLDELARLLDERTDRLRAGGNGVVALQGAVAFAALARRIS